jgi:hypothetical protein
MNAPSRRIWSEHVPFDVLTRPAVLDLLSKRSVGVLVAVQPHQRRRVPDLLSRCADRGVDLALWPLLDDSEGRWPSDANAGAYRGHLLRMLDRVAECGSRPSEVIFDLEPPIAWARNFLRLRLWEGRVRLRPAHMDRALRHFGSLVVEIGDRGLSTTAVVPPMVLWDPLGPWGGWQRLLGTPVDGPAFKKIIVMAYTSLFEGYSQGLLDRRDSRALLASLCQAAKSRWGHRAAVALGVVGGGALGDEAPYRGAAELADDLSITRVAGLEEISLFGLTGILDRPPTQLWLDALVETEPAPNLPPPTWRARTIWLAGVGGSYALRASWAALKPEPR